MFLLFRDGVYDHDSKGTFKIIKGPCYNEFLAAAQPSQSNDFREEFIVIWQSNGEKEKVMARVFGFCLDGNTGNNFKFWARILTSSGTKNVEGKYNTANKSGYGSVCVTAYCPLCKQELPYTGVLDWPR